MCEARHDLRGGGQGASACVARASRHAGASTRPQFAYNVSWVVNILLFVAKGYAWWFSGSKAVLASLVDSFVDLVSQMVIFIAEFQSKVRAPPLRPRLTTLE